MICSLFNKVILPATDVPIMKNRWATQEGRLHYYTISNTMLMNVMHLIGTSLFMADGWVRWYWAKVIVTETVQILIETLKWARNWWIGCYSMKHLSRARFHSSSIITHCHCPSELRHWSNLYCPSVIAPDQTIAPLWNCIQWPSITLTSPIMCRMTNCYRTLWRSKLGTL